MTTNYFLLSDLGCARDLAAREAAAALAMLVKKGLVTLPRVVEVAQEWEAASNALKTEVARGQAVLAIEKASESSRRGTQLQLKFLPSPSGR